MEFLKKHNSVIFFIVTFLCILPITLNVNLDMSDELWNFQNIYKMCIGYQIYVDANVIITPLFFVLGEMLLNFLGTNMFVFRIYNALIMSFLFLFTYLLLKELKIRKSVVIVVSLAFICYNIYNLVLCQANYNTMALAIYVFGTYLLIKYKNSKCTPIIQAFIAFIVFITKQNMGFFYLGGVLLYELIKKDNLNKKIKDIFLIGIIFAILIAIFLIILYSQGILYNFIDYAFLGISEFGNKNLSISIVNIITVCSLGIINICVIIFLLKNIKAKKLLTLNEKENLKILLCLSTTLLFVIIPIMNDMHKIIAIYLSIILLIYIAERLIMKDIKINNKIIIILCIILSSIIMYNTVKSIYDWYNEVSKESYVFKYEEPFFGVIENNKYENIKNVTEFIKKEKEDVIVLSPKAAYYMITLNKSNGLYDLPFKGNFGKIQEDGVVEDLKNKKNTIFLMEDDFVHWQESEKVRNYVKENMEKDGKIEEFTIYKTK